MTRIGELHPALMERAEQVMREEQLREIAERNKRREVLLGSLRTALRQFVEDSSAQDVLPYEQGLAFDQIRHEVIELEAVIDPDSLSAIRRSRRKISRPKRLKVYRRDSYTCQVCAWHPVDVEESERPRDRRPGRHLTVGHRIPVTEGGTNALSNLQTECSTCNGKRGRDLPAEWVA